MHWRKPYIRPLWPIALMMAGCLLASAGCARRAERRHVVLIILDTTRADALGAYGAGATGTANLDALARRGILFREAVAHNPYTLGSVATILTSLEPDLHGIHANTGYRLPEEALTLAEVFRDAGYATAAFVSAYPVREETGLAQGFEIYDDDFSMDYPIYDAQYLPIKDSRQGSERRGEETMRRALQWLDERRPRERPFFLLIHLFDPHQPY